jgi:ATP-binding cassette subfamily C protein
MAPITARVRTPTLLQMEAVECGAAALGIILAYHGRWVTLEELRLACGVSRDGSKAVNIMHAAREYGLIPGAFKAEPEELLEREVPFVVFWRFDHFLVVEGFQGKWVYLNDPGTGPRRVSIEEFDSSFTGVVLSFKPGPDFQKSGRRPGLWKSLAPRLSGSGRAMAYVVLAGWALVIPGIAAPAYTRIFVDTYLVQGMLDWMRPLLIAMVATILLVALLTYLQQEHLLRLRIRLSVTTSSRFLWHVLRLPMEFFSQRYAGEIGSRVALNDQVAGLLSGRLSTTIVSLTSIVFYAVLLFSYQWALALVGLTVALLNLVALRVISRLRVDANRRLLQEQGKLTGATLTGLQMMETIKAGGLEDDYFGRIAGHQAQMANAWQALDSRTQVLNAIPPLLYSLNSAVILGLGALFVIQGDLTVGTLAAFQVLVAGFLAPFSDLVGMGGAIQEAQGQLDRLDDVLNAPLDPLVAHLRERGGTPVLFSRPKLDGYLELKDITFGYSRLDEPLIRDFNLRLTPGQRVALVGGSGSGKTTVANLVCGLYEPWSGQILFDGSARGELPRDVMVNSVARVSQDIYLFEGSGVDNLTMWDTTVPEREMLLAAQDARIDDVMSARPGGFYSQVEEGGTNFSGGERQRMEIARALVTSPTLLILDEATSALDPVTELEIDSNLRRRGCTCLIISHRLSTIRDADEIIVMSHGQVVERGPHDELMRLDGVYARLVQA